MREVRTVVTDIRPNEHVVSIQGTRVDSRFKGYQEVVEGTSVQGPRGGKGTLTLHGANRRVGVVLANGRTPIAVRTAACVVLRDDGE